jgi:hypothetical protein
VSSNATPKKGKANASTMGTLVDCTSRLLLLIKLPGIQTSGAANVLQGFTDRLLTRNKTTELIFRLAQPLA